MAAAGFANPYIGVEPDYMSVDDIRRVIALSGKCQKWRRSLF